MELSVALPCFNEKENIAATVEDVSSWMRRSGIDGEIIAVDDGSTDGTGEELAALAEKEPLLKVVTHSQNRGYGAAVRSGLDTATKEWIAFMDSDQQFHAEDFDRLLAHTDHYEFVTGRRRKRADPFMRKMNAKLFGILSFLILGIWVRDLNCAMKIMKKSVWSRIRPTLATGALFNAELFYNLKRNNIPWKVVDVRHYPRLYGTQTGASIKVILRMFKELFVLRLRK